jgi:hypothetical protein
MKHLKPLPSLDSLKEYLKIDLESPTYLRWIKVPSPYIKLNDPAGSYAKSTNKMRIKFKGSMYMLHRIIFYLYCEIDPGINHVDHTDRNQLNNHPDNLRLATASQNQANKKPTVNTGTSIYKGVSFFKETNRWKVTIGVNCKSIHGGYFKSEKEAALKYNELAELHFKQFAVLNVI